MTEIASGAALRKGRLKWVLGITAAFLVAEVVGGIVTRSLALLADAGHMLTDVAGLGMALFAIRFAARPATPDRSYGYYRAEILAAMANAIVLFAVAGYILYEAWQRFREPPTIDTGPMLVVAIVGLAVNLVSARLLHAAAGDSLNMRGAYFEVLGDLLGSIGVIVAALVVRFTGWLYADPLISVAIGIFILPRTWKLLREAVGVLLEGTPAGMNLGDLERALLAVPGVRSVHDLHVWSLTSGIHAMTAHAVVERGSDMVGIQRRLTEIVRETLNIDHSTIQIELEDQADGEPSF